MGTANKGMKAVYDPENIISPQTVIEAKIVLLGDQGVGKTSIINKFIFDYFDDSSNPTIGIDFISKSIAINENIVRF